MLSCDAQGKLPLSSAPLKCETFSRVLRRLCAPCPNPSQGMSSGKQQLVISFSCPLVLTTIGAFTVVHPVTRQFDFQCLRWCNTKLADEFTELTRCNFSRIMRPRTVLSKAPVRRSSENKSEILISEFELINGHGCLISGFSTAKGLWLPNEEWRQTMASEMSSAIMVAVKDKRQLNYCGEETAKASFSETE